MIDLHTHSTASDGSMSPQALVEEAARLKFIALALTDHDTIDGLDEAETAATSLGIKFIPGVELQINLHNNSNPNSINELKGEFHLLGLGIAKPSRGFKNALEELCVIREKRNLEIVNRMNEMDIKVTYEEILSFSGGKLAGRPHFACFLINKRLVKNQKQAFEVYLGPGKPLYIHKAGMDFEKAVSLIKESGGVAIMAHPFSLYAGWSKMPKVLSYYKERGLDGIEAWHPNVKRGPCSRLDELGRNMGFIITAGSDFHGETRPDRRLGYTAGGRKIDDSFLEELEKAIGHVR